MAITNRPYDDNKIVELTKSLDPSTELLGEPVVSSVQVGYADRDRVNKWIEYAEVSWTTTVRRPA